MLLARTVDDSLDLSDFTPTKTPKSGRPTARPLRPLSHSRLDRAIAIISFFCSGDWASDFYLCRAVAEARKRGIGRFINNYDFGGFHCWLLCLLWLVESVNIARDFFIKYFSYWKCLCARILSKFAKFVLFLAIRNTGCVRKIFIYLFIYF